MKKEARVMQERSLRGTVSVERGMAMKRVVRDCLWEGSWNAESVGSGLRDVGVGNLEGFGEDADGVGRGDEWVDGERVAVGSCGDVGSKGFGVEI